jgi:hypothetical protein
VIMAGDARCDHAHGHRREPHGPGPEDPEVLRTDRILGMLARRELGPWRPGAGHVGHTDTALRLLAALVDDVDQRLSSVSITPST